jgi:enoyl-CoA hydratase/carnithine racemase
MQITNHFAISGITRRMIKLRGDDPNVGAILITGAGGAFCAGGDVKGMGGGAAKAEATFEDRVG